MKQEDLFSRKNIKKVLKRELKKENCKQFDSIINIVAKNAETAFKAGKEDGLNGDKKSNLNENLYQVIETSDSPELMQSMINAVYQAYFCGYEYGKNQRKVKENEFI